MTPEQQRIAIAIAIAEACGWRCIKPNPFSPNPPLCGFNDSQSKTEAANGGSPWGIPDYLNDLNAMHEAEKVLDYNQLCDMENSISFQFGAMPFHSTAAQRAEAFLRALNPTP
jgi:hypothetical protein